MSEREPWMPSKDTIRDAVDDLLDIDWSPGWPEPIRALIRTAVEKALAEEREAWIAALKAVCGESKCHPDFAAMWAKAEADPTYWAELLGLSMDAYRNLEARHAREVHKAERRGRIKAQIEEVERLMEEPLKVHHVGRAVVLDAGESARTRSLGNRLHTLRAALAALEVKGE